MNNKTKLLEITKGNIGTGLLIENDGYISMLEGENKSLYESLQLNENSHEMAIPNPFIVSAVFQKFGIENQNGRIYPENILKREVEKYQIKIKERRSYGECYLPNTLILCENNKWVPLSDIKENDNIVTLNTEANTIEIQSVLKVISYDYNGDMIRIYGDGINDLVTPNHKFPIYNKDKNFIGFFSAEDIFNKMILDQNNCFIPKMDNDFDTIADSNKIFEFNGISLSETSLMVNKEYYNGPVMCVEVPNHTWYCKCNGKAHWTKNCNHPSDSTIDLGRLAINIIELHWEGNTLVGKIEIPISQGFRKLGIISCLADMVAHWILSGLKIGISSRGLGSVEKKFDKLIVGDDFELICWDVVSEPSTPGAWISTDYNELTQYVENINKDNSKLIDSKLNKFSKWLNN